MATPTLKPRIRFKTPAICHKAFKAPVDIPPGAFPPSLNGFASWRDLDPLNPAEFTSTITLRKLHPAGFYGGQSPGAVDFFILRLILDIASQLWTAHLSLHGQRIPPETYVFAPFGIDPTKEFNTGMRTEDAGVQGELRQFQLQF